MIRFFLVFFIWEHVSQCCTCSFFMTLFGYSARMFHTKLIISYLLTVWALILKMTMCMLYSVCLKEKYVNRMQEFHFKVKWKCIQTIYVDLFHEFISNGASKPDYLRNVMKVIWQMPKCTGTRNQCGSLYGSFAPIIHKKEWKKSDVFHQFI